MSVRVRFAPSPTGFLHIGGARTALYNYLFAKATGGTFVLRIEDTDPERSKREYEELQLEDLKWLGMEHDEGPGIGGDFGPYRQSERSELYQKYSQQLVEEKKAYYCFCSTQELEEKKEKAMAEGNDPVYDGTCRKVTIEEAKKRMEAGEQAVIRFLVPDKSYILEDKVRGKVEFPANMVGDFVIMRSGGLPVYNFCCVIDDWQMKISHVIRGEDHLNNTLRQLMVYEALGAETPIFAHVSLLVGQDRQKLSKRHGTTSVTKYRDDSYLPNAMVNYLSLLGWSHPEELDIFNIDDLKSVFNIDRFSKAPAVFDLEKFRWINGQHLKNMDDDLFLEKVKPFIPQENLFHQQGKQWQLKSVALLKTQIDFFNEFTDRLPEIFDADVSPDEDIVEVLGWETTPKIAKYLKEELDKVEGEFVELELFNQWTDHIKKEMKIKGKFLFKGVRGCLTGRGHGPDLKALVTLTKTDVLKARVKKTLG